MKLLKKFFISFLFIFVLSFNNQVFSWSLGEESDGNTDVHYCDNDECGFNNGITEVGDNINGLVTDQTASEYVQNVVKYLVGFLYLIGVILLIYSGFNILTSIGEEEKIKKSKDIIKYTIIGLIVVFLADRIILFLLDVFNQVNG